MKTKVITVSVQEDVEERFRKLAGIAYGKHKGYLGKAITEAMKEWEKRKKETDVNARALEMLKKGFNLGGITYKKRAELHERK